MPSFSECTSSVSSALEGSCFAVILSKLLSFLIIAGSLIVKLPQIMKIWARKSVEGLDFSMFLLETVGYGVQVSYCFRSHFAFSTYGESVAMLIQNTTIVILMYKFTSGLGSVGFVGTMVALATGQFLCFSWVPMEWLQTLQGGTVLLFIVSKVPQIVANQRQGSTGNLDAFMFFLQFGGGAARVFTTLQEVGDLVFLTGFVVGTLLNGTILLQILLLGSGGNKKQQKKKTK